MFQPRTYWANRLMLTFEKLQLVRKDRGKKAQGDILLVSAQKAIKFKCRSSARQDLESFLSIVKDLTPVQKSILEAECERLSPRWNSRDGPILVEMIIFMLELLLWLMGRYPISCQHMEFISN